MCKKIKMIILQDSAKSQDKIKYYIKTTKHLATCTMLVYTTVHPGVWSCTGYQWNFYYAQYINSTQGLYS